MKKLSLLVACILLIGISCAPKVYFFQAEKLRTVSNQNTLPLDIDAGAYFAGDALDYVVFELDVFNNSNDTITMSYRDVFLEVKEHPAKTIIIDALPKDEIIRAINERHRQLESEKKARDITNAVNIGLDLLVIGSTGGMDAVGSIIYAADAATYIMEDSRVHKLMVGDLEEQKAYVEEWVLEYTKLPPQQEGSWDILLPRRLFNAPATFFWTPEGYSFSQDFELTIREERAR